MLLGPNRGRQFLLMGEEISAQEAKSLGFIAEVVPHDRVQDRAWELAAGLAAKPAMMLRYTRVAFTQHIKRRMNDDLGYGLMLEGMAIMNLGRQVGGGLRPPPTCFLQLRVPHRLEQLAEIRHTRLVRGKSAIHRDQRAIDKARFIRRPGTPPHWRHPAAGPGPGDR